MIVDALKYPEKNWCYIRILKSCRHSEDRPSYIGFSILRCCCITSRSSFWVHTSLQTKHICGEPKTNCVMNIRGGVPEHEGTLAQTRGCYHGRETARVTAVPWRGLGSQQTGATALAAQRSPVRSSARETGCGGISGGFFCPAFGFILVYMPTLWYIYLLIFHLLLYMQ